MHAALQTTILGLALASAGAINTTLAAQAQPENTVPTFHVRLLPLDTTGEGATDKALLEKIHTAMAERLQAIPGLTLLAQAPASADVTVNYEVEMKPRVGRGVQLADFRVRTLSQPAGIPTENPRAEVTAVAPSNQADVVDLRIIPSNLIERMNVVAGYGERADPERDMQGFVTRLQGDTFPVRPYLKAQLLDPQVEMSHRQEALYLLLTRFLWHGLPEPAIVQSGVDLASNTTDPEHRSAIWKRLGASRSPELVGPLVTALGTEKDDNVRLDLVGVISRDFSADPGIRSALENVARSDRQQITRMAAQRVLTNDGSWNEYVLATLGNPQLGNAQRLAPLAYLESSGLGAQGRPALNDEAMRTLGRLIGNAESYTPGVRAAALALASANSIVAIDLIIDVLRPRGARSTTGHAVRDTVLYHVGARGHMDPRIRTAFEEVAARDADPAVRGTAQALLDSDARMKARDANAGLGQ